MEKFKAVEKEMKTKAYSKEGLQAAAKLDPKEREKAEVCNFLTDMVDSLDRQIEQNEAESEGMLATIKRGKKDTAKAERIAELERVTERHRWHQGKLELILRTLENGGIEADQVKELEEGIRYYVDDNGEVNFLEDDSIYDELNLQEEEEIFGAGGDMDRQSSQDAQSVAGDQDTDLRPTISGTGKQKVSDPASTHRRPSTQMKSPLPALATLHAQMPSATNGTVPSGMKPAPPPTITPGAPLKYASAAAAAAASDQNELGISPLPPAPSRGTTSVPTGLSPAVTSANVKASTGLSPAVSNPHPLVTQPPRHASLDSQPIRKSPAPTTSLPAVVNPEPVAAPQSMMDAKSRQVSQPEVKKATESPALEEVPPGTPALTNGDTHSEVEEEESIYHLPSSLNDLLESFQATKAAGEAFSDPVSQHLFAASFASAPEAADAERPRHYRPKHPYPYTPGHFPQEPSPIFDDPRLYSRVDTDTLFYTFYYRQNTYQQFLAAKALKNQSWRFHKQYQTWFQRHEEPKSITEDYEQGTYRFFDYESTWFVQDPNIFIIPFPNPQLLG